MGFCLGRCDSYSGKKSENHLLASEGYVQFSILNIKIKLGKQNIIEIILLVTYLRRPRENRFTLD